LRRAIAGRWPFSTVVRRAAAALTLAGLLFLAACGAPGQASRDQLWRAPVPDSGSPAARVRLLQAETRAAMAARRHGLLVAAANWYLARMSLDEQLGQMILTGFNGNTYSSDMAIMVTQEHVGGLQLFGYNFGAPSLTRQAMTEAQTQAHIPLLVTTDQEGGSVNRILPYFGPFPSAGAMGASGDPAFAYQTGRRTALDLEQFGVNADLAPVVDVPVDGGWVWSQQRVFSDDPRTVARYAGAFMAGLQSAGMVTCLKHFPGLGSVRADPHTTLPDITRSLAQLRSTELYPYAALIPQMPDMIMTTDVLLPAVDSTYPAELSPGVITGLLRLRLGYGGVVVTDALWMEGISQRWGQGEAAVLAVLAGDDLLMAAYDSGGVRLVLDTLRAAVNAGRITRTRVAQSVRRILLLKLAHGLLPIPQAVLGQSPLVAA
jgi:beta-N-acetylhexosaminidase